jgi:hypothetical protein
LQEQAVKVHDLEIALPLIGASPTHALSGVADWVKGLLTRDHNDQGTLSYWQKIFLQSKANGCSYCGEHLPQSNWKWPKNTWFQERLSCHRKNVAWHSEAVLSMTIGPLQN